MPAMKYQPGCACCGEIECCIPDGDLQLELPDRTITLNSFFSTHTSDQIEYTGIEIWAQPDLDTPCVIVGTGSIFLTWSFRCRDVSGTLMWELSATDFRCIDPTGPIRPGGGSNGTTHLGRRAIERADCAGEFMIAMKVGPVPNALGNGWPYDPEVDAIITEL